MKNKKENRISAKTKILIIVGILLFIAGSLLWARFISTRGLQVKEVKIDIPTLNEAYDGLKIVQFTDLHYGSTIHRKELDKVVETINNQNADVVVFSGDLVENKVVLNEDEVKYLTDSLNKIEAKIEKYAVKGNHDYDHNYFDQILPKTDFILLNNSYDYFYKDSETPIIFTGLDDLDKGKPDYKSAFSFLQEFEEQPYTILLIHEPDQVDELGEYNFNLALAGHSHLGQVRFPLIGSVYSVKGARKYPDDHYKVSNGDLYVSSGIGTSTLRLRFFNKPSITLYRFYTK